MSDSTILADIDRLRSKHHLNPRRLRRLPSLLCHQPFLHELRHSLPCGAPLHLPVHLTLLFLRELSRDLAIERVQVGVLVERHQDPGSTRILVHSCEVRRHGKTRFHRGRDHLEDLADSNQFPLRRQLDVVPVGRRHANVVPPFWPSTVYTNVSSNCSITWHFNTWRNPPCVGITKIVVPSPDCFSLLFIS